ncbi:MAG TPA: SDR family NAD(P)-dependent oxidoreductase [Bordetella sp.]
MSGLSRQPSEQRGKTGLVTGAAGGIGLRTAERLALAGATVLMVDQNQPALQQRAQALATLGYRVQALALDVADVHAAQRVEQALAELGTDAVDYLVNCAGISPKADGRRVPAWQVDPAEFQRVIAINLCGYFNMARAVAPGMIQTRRGAIVNIGSLAGLRYSSIAGVAYATSKAGVTGLTQQLAGELAPFNVRVNAVAPGRIESPMSAMAAAGINDAILAGTPLGRLGTPDDIVDSVFFLLSEQAGFITGQTLAVTGGRGL